LFGPKGPQSHEWRQGGTGDCTLGAAVRSMASTAAGRQRLAQIITERADGSYDVKMWDQTINVKLDKVLRMPVAFGDPTGSGGNAIWPKVLEAAFAKGAYARGFELRTNDNTGLPPSLALQALTGGQKPEWKELNQLPQPQIYAVVNRALKVGQVLITGTVVESKATDTQRNLATANGLLLGHAFALLGADVKSGTVLLADPLGGTLRLPISTFQRLFTHIYQDRLPLS
jgi:Calpain family cysteine protease